MNSYKKYFFLFLVLSMAIDQINCVERRGGNKNQQKKEVQINKNNVEKGLTVNNEDLSDEKDENDDDDFSDEEQEEKIIEEEDNDENEEEEEEEEKSEEKKIQRKIDIEKVLSKDNLIRDSKTKSTADLVRTLDPTDRLMMAKLRQKIRSILFKEKNSPIYKNTENKILNELSKERLSPDDPQMDNYLKDIKDLDILYKNLNK